MIAAQDIICSIDSFTLTAGGVSGDLDVKVCLCGDQSRPVVALLGGISASRWALDVNADHSPGWWSQVVHADSFLNPTDHCFLTFEYFAFPDQVVNPPVISTADQAHVLRQIQSQLNLPQLHAVIGSSYGGMVSLAFAAAYPRALKHMVCIAAADRNSVKTQALRHIQRQILHLGELNESPEAQSEFMALARSLAMVGYRGEAEWEQRFQQPDAADSLHGVSSYLHHHGQRFATDFSAARYKQLSRSIDYHQVNVGTIEASALLIGITSDQMVPSEFIQSMDDKLKCPSRCHLIDSVYGHDGFLLEAEQLNQIFTSYFSEQTHDYIKQNCRRASGY